jgi:hypothetical protein
MAGPSRSNGQAIPARSGEVTVKRMATTLLVAGLMAAPMLALAPAAQARVDIGIGISVGLPPPALPVYAQPVIPGPGYIWTPGYWAWDPEYGDYYWVPGTWVMPPQMGLLWTPGWWGWSDGFYRWHPGYWGTHVGFYGGIDYGHGYFGNGYSGGEWRGRTFYYNRAVNNVTNIHNVYVNRTVINNVHTSRVSYNGGRGGIAAQPSAQQRAWANQRRIQATSMQRRQRETAMHDPAQRFKSSQGRPAVFATQRAGNFAGPHAVRAPRSANNRNAGAPGRERSTAAPDANRRMMQAPHNRARPPRPADQPFRQEHAARPAGERGSMQVPRERPRQMRQPNQSFRQERTAPPRSQATQPAAHRGPPPRSSEQDSAHPDRKHGNNGGPGHR